jgi:hypothetical protein
MTDSASSNTDQGRTVTTKRPKCCLQSYLDLLIPDLLISGLTIPLNQYPSDHRSGLTTPNSNFELTPRGSNPNLNDPWQNIKLLIFNTVT